MDINMPGLPGLEILKQLRLANRDIPVMVVTKNDALDSAIEAMKVGAFDYMVKPVDKIRLKTNVENERRKEEEGSGAMPLPPPPSLLFQIRRRLLPRRPSTAPCRRRRRRPSKALLSICTSARVGPTTQRPSHRHRRRGAWSRRQRLHGASTRARSSSTASNSSTMARFRTTSCPSRPLPTSARSSSAQLAR